MGRPRELKFAARGSRLNGSDDDRVKLLQVTSIDTTIVVLLWAQIRAAKVAGYNVRCACQPGGNRAWLESQGVEYLGVEINRSITPLADLRALWRLFRYCRREKIAIVHTHTPKAALLGQVAAWLAGVPVIINTVHGFYFHDEMKLLPRWFYIAMAWLGGRCATLTLSQNREDIATAVRLGIAKPNDIRFLGNGIDLSRFDPARFDRATREKTRASLGLPSGCIVIGAIGRLVVDKGYIELFEALRALHQERDDFHLLIIGPEEPHRAGRIAADEYKRFGIEAVTTYVGPRDDVEELMACMDVFVLPSWREGFPRSAIEAAAMGLPIITTDVRGCREVVTDGENGLLVPARDPVALAAALRAMLDNGAMRERMGRVGRERAMRDFDESGICRRVIDIYAELLIRRGIDPPTPRADLNAQLPRRGRFVW